MMVKCRECGKEIAENARTCPYCGSRTPTNNRLVWRYIGAAIGIIVIIRYVLWPMISK